MEQDFGDDCQSESESDDDVEESTSDSEIEDDVNHEEDWTSSNEAKSDCSDKDEDDAHPRAEAALKKLVPIEDFAKVWFLKHEDFCILSRSTLIILR